MTSYISRTGCYLCRRLVSEGIVTLGVMLSRCVCVSAEPHISRIDCRPHYRISLGG